MHPVINAILFLLRHAHASGNHPQGDALAHVRAIEEFVQPSTEPTEEEQVAKAVAHQTEAARVQQRPPAPAEASVPRFMKVYPCGCTAGPGPADMPDYCPDHGHADETIGCQTVEVPMRQEGALAAAGSNGAEIV